ncbi:MAG: glycosyltransferase [Mangrovibacterium sp.]
MSFDHNYQNNRYIYSRLISEQMKIAIIGPAHPYRGGIATYNERLASEFQAEGHEVKIITFTLQYPNFLFPGETQYTNSAKPAHLDIERRINSVHPANWIKVGNQLKNECYDVIIARYWIPLMAPALGTILRGAKKNKHTKIIALVDNMIPHEKRIGDRLLSKYFVGAVDAFMAMSQSVADDIASFNEQKPRDVSPHPLFDNYGEIVSREESLKKLNLSPDFRYILSFGLIRDYKGLDLLYQAMSDVRFTRKNIRLIVAGEYYANAEKYKNMVQKLGIDDRVIQHTFFISDEDVKYYFGASDVVVQPYKSATQSGVTQVAYHFNRPMIVTNVGGLTELCPDGKVGYICQVDPSSIADSILRFFDEDKFAEFTANVQEEKKRFAWGVMTKKLLALVD